MSLSIKIRYSTERELIEIKATKTNSVSMKTVTEKMTRGQAESFMNTIANHIVSESNNLRDEA